MEISRAFQPGKSYRAFKLLSTVRKGTSVNGVFFC